MANSRGTAKQTAADATRVVARLTYNFARSLMSRCFTGLHHRPLTVTSSRLADCFLTYVFAISVTSLLIDLAMTISSPTQIHYRSIQEQTLSQSLASRLSELIQCQYQVRYL